MKELTYSVELKYIPPPIIPASFTDEMEKLVPNSLTGMPKLRFVWGMDRKEYCAGYEYCRYSDINDPPKYIGRECWVLEGLQPPEIFDRDEWDERLLGPFPNEGSYDFVAYHEGLDKEYLPLDERALQKVRVWAKWQTEGRKKSIEHIMEERMLRWSLDEQKRQEKMDKVGDEFAIAATKCFENATDTPKAFSLPTTGAFEQTPSGILIPKN